jgi:hypothetical protein
MGVITTVPASWVILKLTILHTYGGADNPYEAIKIIEALELGFCLGSMIKYVCRAGKKPGAELIEDLKKARWYLDREIQNLEVDREGALTTH